MKVDYDINANAAYIYLVPIRRDEVERTHSVAGEGIMLDFSDQGTLAGIEVQNASTRLPAYLLGEALLGGSANVSLYGALQQKREPKLEATLTPEERERALIAMKAAAKDFYFAAVRIGVHPFIEFTGLMNEYINICERAHQEGIDFAVCSTHSGSQLPMRDYEVIYVNEKLQCIFTGRSVMSSKSGGAAPPNATTSPGRTT